MLSSILQMHKRGTSKLGILPRSWCMCVHEQWSEVLVVISPVPEPWGPFSSPAEQDDDFFLTQRGGQAAEWLSTNRGCRGAEAPPTLHICNTRWDKGSWATWDHLEAGPVLPGGWWAALQQILPTYIFLLFLTSMHHFIMLTQVSATKYVWRAGPWVTRHFAVTCS